MRTARCQITAVLLFSFLTQAYSLAEESHPGMDIETQYAEAVLAFNGKRYDDTVHFLDQIIRVQPKNIEALELKALTLKTAGKETKSIEVYAKLIRAKPEAERGPYYFEVGSIYFKQKRFKEAQPYFERSIKLN